MPTITFDTHANDGIIQIPETFKEWYGKTLKVMLLSEETAIPVTSPPRSIPQEVDYLTLMKELSDAQSGRPGEAATTLDISLMEVEAVCGLYQATQSVSLEEMDEAIQRGAIEDDY
jgi:hypothetical protein